MVLANPSAKYSKPNERKKFEEFLSAAPETVDLVLTESVEPKEAERHWLVKWAAKGGARAQGFMLPRQKDMPGWIVNEARNQGGALEPSAAAKLAEMVGTDTRQAGVEIAKLLAYVNRQGSSFRVTTLELETGSVRTLSDTLDDESPSFAPNGRLLVYATRQQGRDVLMTSTLDGKIKTRLVSSGADMREPAWGPFSK